MLRPYMVMHLDKKTFGGDWFKKAPQLRGGVDIGREASRGLSGGGLTFEAAVARPLAADGRPPRS